MRVAVTGSSGLIGSALVRALEDDGHRAVRLVRRQPAGPSEVRWDPEGEGIDPTLLAGIDAAVHLAGEGIGARRWTPAQKERIRNSRVRGTAALAAALATLDPKPGVFVSGSAIGYYGIRDDEVLTEASSAGGGFLASVVQEWEQATAAAEGAGIRTVHLRSGIVVSGRGGALGRMLPLFRLGLGGRLSTGRQWWSWISLRDEVGLILHALTNEAVAGPMNATAPAPVTNAEFTRALARVLRRPAVLPVPKFALEVAMGRGLAREVGLAGQRVLPAVAEATGYRFLDPEVEGALSALFGPTAASG